MNRRNFLAGSAFAGMRTRLRFLGVDSATYIAQSKPVTSQDRTVGAICSQCGSEFCPSHHKPESCPICQDSRQYVGWKGQQWTTLTALSESHENVISQEEQGLYSIFTKPDFAIGQRAFLVQTPHGNLLWDCVALLDDNTKTAIHRLGGISAIAISHPHYYTTMVQWSRAFSNAPIYLHELNRKWVMRPDPAIRFWQGETLGLFSGLTLIRTGGHFDGFQVLHMSKAPDGDSVLLAGDQPEVCMDRSWVTFMYSYPNYIPLNRRSIQGIVSALAPFSFDRLYAAFPGRQLNQNARQIVFRSAERYIDAIS